MFVPSEDAITLTVGTQGFFTHHFLLLFVLDPEVHHLPNFYDILFTIIIRFHRLYSFTHLTNGYCAK